jgi:hypothetical protein
MKKKSNEEFINDLSLVVLSSESYSFLWLNFIILWQKYCKKLNLKKFIITTNLNKNYKNFKIISGKFDKDDFWSNRIRSALKKVQTKNVLVFTDDCFVNEYLNIYYFKKIYENFKRKKIVHLRLCPIPNENIFNKRGIYKLSYFSFHRISLQPGLWDKKYLEKLLSKNETPRIFEEYGSKRTKIEDNIFSSNYYIINFKEIIRVGKVTPEGKKLIKKENLNFNKFYKFMNLFDLFDHYFKNFKSIIFYLLPKIIRNFYIKKKYSKDL